MAKMKEDTLLNLLQRYEDEASEYTFGALRTSRERAYKDYFQQPYGNEEEGWSQLVTSDVQDTVEWVLPDLLDQFLSTDKVVEFEPTRAADKNGAEQATDTCNYVFLKQNNGFLILYTAFKDALIAKNSATHWFKQTYTQVEKQPLRGVPELQIRYLESEGWERPKDSEIEALGPQPIQQPDGSVIMSEPLFNVLMTRQVEKTRIKVETFEPERLHIQRYWASPLLDDCPYVCREMPVTLSDIKEMGIKGVTAEDLAASDRDGSAIDDIARRSRQDEPGQYYLDSRSNEVETDDESQTVGWLRIEWVLADRDGDGIAERLEVKRLADKILSVEECSQVPIATGSPILVAHQWDGMSVAETVADLQRLRTELMRQTVNNATLANNPRTTVMTDAQGAPLANIDDLLDGRPGAILRQSRMDAIGTQATPFVGGAMFTMMEYIDQMREQRTGITKQQQGMDPNSLRTDRTAQEVVLTANAARQRVKLIARIFAETLVKPIFKGILRLLTEGDMKPIAYRLREQFVEFDPNEWADEYDMTCNVGLGTGDRDQMLAMLNRTFQTQMGLMQTPVGAAMVTPTQIYNTQAKMLDITGCKNVGDYFTQPPPGPLPPPPPAQPPYQVQIEQMRQQGEAQKVQFETQADMQRFQIEQQGKLQAVQMQYEKEAQNDKRDFQKWQWEAESKERIELAKIQAKRESDIESNRTSIITARIAHPETQLTDLDIDPLTGETFQKPDPLPLLLNAVGQIAAQQNAPKIIIRDPLTNKVVGVQQGDVVQQVVRDASGQVVGVQ